ncbi:MAG TPA: hypothetical protein VFW71_01110 [Actinomycetota bacterium]|nr:hypothetical protein [Actinomycetota bacterium]
MPTLEYLNGLSITKRLEGALELPRKVSHPAYQDRARVARQAADPFLGATLTDLKEPLKDELPHSPFDPPVPRGITLSERLIACREAIGERGAELVSKSLAGTLSRVAANGLGFDARRFPSGVQPGAGPMVDPVVECLAFFGLALFPVRGNGPQIRTRGWKDWEFGWVAWSSALDCWGIDALLDQVQAFAPDTRAARESLWRLGVLTRYRSVAFQPVGSADTRRGYASRRVE